MQTTLMLKEHTPLDAEHAFDQHIHLKLHEYLRNECILSPEGIGRVMPALRDIYTSGMFSMAVQFEMKIASESVYEPHKGVISKYCLEAAPGLMQTINDAAALAAFHMLKACAKHLTALDDASHPRKAH
jgi:hypothetical protein